MTLPLERMPSSSMRVCAVDVVQSAVRTTSVAILRARVWRRRSECEVSFIQGLRQKSTLPRKTWPRRWQQLYGRQSAQA